MSERQQHIVRAASVATLKAFGREAKQKRPVVGDDRPPLHCLLWDVEALGVWEGGFDERPGWAGAGYGNSWVGVSAPLGVHCLGD